MAFTLAQILPPEAATITIQAFGKENAITTQPAHSRKSALDGHEGGSSGQVAA